MKRRVRQKQSSFANATKTALGVGVISLVGVVAAAQVSALTYQNNVNVSFTIEDTITISLSSPNLVINELAPGAANDSNIITVNVQSNNPRGYTLNSTVGSSTYNNRNLTHATSNSATPFSSINYGTTVSTLNGFSPNQWGYSFSLDGGTTWINANKTGNVNDTGYSGLPLYTDEEHITTLKESDTTTPAGGDNVKFKIAAKAASAQASGEYNNVINFTAIGVPAPAYYIQDLSASECQARATDQAIIVYDRRDGSDYTVRYINGNCWMTQNLRITGTISATDSNFTTSPYSGTSNINTLAGGDLRGGSYTYLDPQSHRADSTDTAASSSWGYTINQLGAWYNFCAASAGEVCQSSGVAQNATQDICPAGWHLPNNTGNTTGGEMYDLVEALNNNSTLKAAFSPLYGGTYATGTLKNATTYGEWWTSTASNAYAQYVAPYISQILYHDNNGRGYGYYIRCIRST
ncbi:MAG: fibrobacter succinogenes major paralogous domain-containing protein [Candidatus Saccharibacteria bacterium]|nr:fibrobacter succinogenes major paralogous domain-containing protein [Candidatus Saccharibacteria bacterium]